MKRLILFIIFCFSIVSTYAQRDVQGNRVIALDSVYINGEWISISGASDDEILQRESGRWVNKTFAGLANPVDSIHFDSTTSIPVVKYAMYADTANRTISVNLGNGVVLQVGQETLIEVYNNSGATIENGRICYGTGINGSAITIAKADSTGRYTALVAATENIPNGSYGFCVELAGKIRGINTSGLSTGSIFVGSDGQLTNTAPVFPAYEYPVGACLVSDATNGVIQFRSDGTNYNNITRNAFNGSFVEDFDFLVTSNGTTVTGSLQSDLGGDLQMIFSDGWSDLDCTPAATVTLTAGTDANEQLNYVYIDKTTKVLTVSTSYWPPTEHIPVAVVSLQSAATTQTRGVSRNQNINNHIASVDNQMGRLDHMSKRIRTLNCEYSSGMDLTITGSGTTTVTLSTTAGQAWQMHLQDFSAIDIATDYIKVVNRYSTPGTWVNDLTSIVNDAAGVSLNNKYFNVVIWGVQNSATDPDHLCINMPTGGYNNLADAQADANGYTVSDIPAKYKSVGFLMYRLIFQATSTGTIWTHHQTYNWRGKIPNTTVSGTGGGGGGGVTSFTGLTDTPSSYAGQSNKIVKVGSSETALEFGTVTMNAGAISNVTTLGASGNITGSRFVSTIGVGTSPLSVTSTTLNTNLNADFLDGQHGSYYLDFADTVSTLATQYDLTTISGASLWTLGGDGLSYKRTGTFKGAIGVGVDANDLYSGYFARDSIGNSGYFFNNGGDGLLTYVDNTSNYAFRATSSAATIIEAKGSGVVRFGGYGSGTKTGTPTYYAAFDASGNIIETSSAATTIYSGDGTLTGNRKVTVGNNELLFEGEGALSYIDLYVYNSGKTQFSNVALADDGLSLMANGAASGFGYIDVTFSGVQLSGSASGASTTVQVNNTDMSITGTGLLRMEEASTFATPATGNVLWYAKTDGLPYFKNDTGQEYGLLTGYSVPNATPSSASDTGTAGQISYDTNYIYICVATNTWKRVALSTW